MEGITKALAPCFNAEQIQHNVAASNAVTIGKVTSFVVWLETVRSTVRSLSRLLVRLVVLLVESVEVLEVVLALLQQ